MTIFALDLMTPLGYAEPMLYVLPILLTWLVPGRNSTAYMTGSAIVLTWVGVVFSPGKITPEAIANRALTCTLLLVAAGLLIKQRQLTELAATARDAHRESEERLRLFIEHAPAALAMFDRDLHYLGVSRRWIADYLPGVSNILGQSHYELFPECPDRLKTAHKRGMAGEVVREEEDSWRRADGTVLWVRYEIRPWYKHDSAVGGIVVFAEDITQRKHSEESLRHSRDLLDSFVQNTPAAVAMLDKNLQYVAVSRRWLEDYRLGNQNLLGRYHYEVFPEIATMQRWKAVHQRCLAGAVEKCEEDLFVRADGSEDWIRWEVHPWRDVKGHIAGIILFTENISQRKQAQLALQENEQRLHLALNSAQMGMWDWDPLTDLVVWSEHQFELFDIRKEEFAGSSAPVFEKIHSDDRSRVQLALLHARERGVEFRQEFRVVHRDGTVRWLMGIGRPLRDLSGNCSRLIGINFDITDRKKIHETLTSLNATLEQRVNERAAELVRANERFEWMVNATHDGVYDWDLLNHTVFYSPRWKEMHGFQESELLETSKDWSDRIHPDDRSRVLGTLEAYWQQEHPEFWEEYRIRRKDGTYMWVLDRGIAIRDDQGRAIRMVGAETDITWRKEAEETLRRQEHEFHALADNVPAFFAYIGLDRRYRYVNKRYEELFGLPTDEIVKMTVEQLLGREGYAQVGLHLDEAFHGAACSFEYRLEPPGMGECWLSAQYVPDRNKAGHVIGLFVLLSDITQLKLTEAMLRKREEELSQLSAKLLLVQEEERRRIAREIHDDLTQRLAALTLELYRLSSHETGENSFFNRLQTMAKSSEELTSDLQKLAHHLHPAILEHVGLEAAARELVEDFAVKAGLETEIMVKDLPKDIPLERATCLYRILQESLRNVQKHAKAQNVLVRIVQTAHGIGICVHDDGQGFEKG
ncbi:PAS domain S-box protein, partial [Petrachloros mirabilis]